MVYDNTEVVHKGWLTKSPPPKRLLKMRWRTRYFVLRSGELPNQFLLEYFVDESCRKLKGSIDLDQCEQIDAGIMFAAEKDNGDNNNFMFDIKTPSRTYYLKCNTENEMNRWVDCLCQVCGLKAQNDDVPTRPPSSLLPPLTPLSGPPLDLLFSQNSGPESNVSPNSISCISGPYIPISECITGRKGTTNATNNHSNNNSANNARNSSRFPFQHSPNSHKKMNMPTEMAPSAPLTGGASPLGEDGRLKPRSGDAFEPSRSMRGASQSSGGEEALGATGFRSPLTDTSSSVFTDEDWPWGDKEAPPRPPKPPHLEVPSQSYMNIETVSRAIHNRKTGGQGHDVTSSSDAEPSPLSACSSLASAPTPGPSSGTEHFELTRSHTRDSSERAKRQGYGAAPPSSVTSDRVFSYDLRDSVASPPDSELYCNLPSSSSAKSPAFPPSINRGLKPKVSDTSSGCDSSPLEGAPSCGPPVVHRNLKPHGNRPGTGMTTPSPQEFILEPAPRSRPKAVGVVGVGASRAAPSPLPQGKDDFSLHGAEMQVPPLSARDWRTSALQDDTVFYPISATSQSTANEIQYLDLDLNGIKIEDSEPQAHKSCQNSASSTSAAAHSINSASRNNSSNHSNSSQHVANKKENKMKENSGKRESSAKEGLDSSPFLGLSQQSLNVTAPPAMSSSVEYQFVDFVKTDALTKMKKDVEENYNKNNQ